MKLKIYYRISDKSYEKAKLPGLTKEMCLMNFCKAFVEDVFGKSNSEGTFEPAIRIIADNCDRKTLKTLRESGLPLTITSEGNSGALKKAIEIALEECEDEDIIYFVEDDYLHLGSSPQLIREVADKSDYFTLYDHPDKYSDFYKGGETSKVFRTKSSHWRYTISTCMTFGTKAKTLREDIEIWDKHLKDTDHPPDHRIFAELNEKGRKLAVCIPGAACHCDLTFSGMINEITIENWAVELLVQEFEDSLYDENTKEPKISSQEIALKNSKEGFERLMFLDIIRQRNNIK